MGNELNLLDFSPNKLRSVSLILSMKKKKLRWFPAPPLQTVALWRAQTKEVT